MSRQHVVIVGGGIVGMATAREATSRGHQVTLLEKEPQWAAHQTGHNSGVIHAGPYYKPGSVKAQLCTAGNASMVKFAQEYGIPYRVTGKLIVATTPTEERRLADLLTRAQANGVPAELISGEEARVLEPHVGALKALHVKSTGIIDYSKVTSTLAELAEQAGARLLLGEEALDIRSSGDSIEVIHTNGTIRGDILINCAGLYSDVVAKKAGLNPRVRIIPFRGEYYELAPDSQALVNGLIYPVPDPTLPFLGVHFTRMIDGSVHAGPNAVTALAREGYRWSDVKVSELVGDLTYSGFLNLARKNVSIGAQEIFRSLSKKLFTRSLRRLIPEITEADIVRAGSGVRAQAIDHAGSLVDDFLFEYAERQVHVLNAPSPAATSSLEIAKAILDASVR